NAIECFCDCAEFPPSKRDYARTFCWLKNTYKVDISKPFPKDPQVRRTEEIAYYQW
ncbi:innexin unc-9 isoform X2, partial [Biomphalaria glabrata]